MDTSVEAVLRALLNDGKFDKIGGDVKSPIGYFGYTYIEYDDIDRILSGMEHVTSVYGMPSDDELVGPWFLVINSDGVLTTVKSDMEGCLDRMDEYAEMYHEWLYLENS